MPTDTCRRYAIHEDFPDRIPPGEIWLDESLAPTEREEAIAEASARLAQIDDQALVETVVQALEPQLASIVSRAIERELQGRLEELFDEWRETEGDAIKSGIITELLRPLVDNIQRIATPLVTVEMPPPNPTPITLTMPADTPKRRRRRFTRDGNGEIDGVEEIE